MFGWIKRFVETLGLVSYEDPHAKWAKYRPAQTKASQESTAKERPRAKQSASTKPEHKSQR